MIYGDVLPLSQMRTVHDFRTLIAAIMAPTIERHRAAHRFVSDNEYDFPEGDVTDDEIDQFIASCPGLHFETGMKLSDPGLLGFWTLGLDLSERTRRRLRGRFAAWAAHDDWLNARLPWLRESLVRLPHASELWRPGDSHAPVWISSTASALLLAAALVDKGRPLSELGWRQFEELVGALLEHDGWSVEITKPTKDGGVDVIGTREDPILGPIRSIWQAKKYSRTNTVKLHEVRELSAIREEARATKGLMVTTSHLTRDAIAWMRQDIYRLGFLEHDQVANWIRRIRP